ncbi:MAG: anaerobic ribonucleoside-triphosphate reductase activating protein [Treponema sp.]|jgi:pyruvate formate lyase activating enzyme|nr:anaerobic ribonucleoside-triphosphate reductase activating protein [Treponema sp.]
MKQMTQGGGGTIGGVSSVKISLRKTSLVDYPGKIASVLFFTGCNMRCPWCHNRELVLPKPASARDADPEELVSLDRALAHIEKRRNVLGGVVLSGGEPSLYRDLPALIRRIKEMGLAVKLDTNGMNPGMLEKLFQTKETAPDYIALDLKLAPLRYGEMAPDAETSAQTLMSARMLASADSLRKSADFIRNSGIAHEYRTLALPTITEKDIAALAELTDDAPWYVRAFRPGNCLDPTWDDFEPSNARDAGALADAIRALGKNGVSG